MYGFNKARIIDGSMNEGPKYGSYCLTAVRVRAGWGVVAEHRWPFPRGHVTWPPVEPPGLDRIARFNRTLSHFRIRSIDEGKRCLAGKTLFGFSVPITRQWYTAKDGIIEMPHAPFLDQQHAVTAVGYNDSTGLRMFINSWGREWGQSGIGYLPYEYFNRFVSDGWFTCPMNTGRWLPEIEGQEFSQRVLVVRNPLGHAGVIIDLWDVPKDIRIGWCFMTLRMDGGPLEIEDYFLKPEFYGTGHQRTLAEKVLHFAISQELPIKLWVPYADIRSRAANFRNLNDFIRTARLNLRPSPHSWAAYLGE